ncbi:MAG: hypothetical protein V7K90_27365 [Nostoc sp.]
MPKRVISKEPLFNFIAPTVGDRTRITIGGFLSFSKEHDAIYYWS